MHTTSTHAMLQSCRFAALQQPLYQHGFVTAAFDKLAVG